jgi:hypothetical protein
MSNTPQTDPSNTMNATNTPNISNPATTEQPHHQGNPATAAGVLDGPNRSGARDKEEEDPPPSYAEATGSPPNNESRPNTPPRRTTPPRQHISTNGGRFEHTYQGDGHTFDNVFPNGPPNSGRVPMGGSNTFTGNVDFSTTYHAGSGRATVGVGGQNVNSAPRTTLTSDGNRQTPSSSSANARDSHGTSHRGSTTTHTTVGPMVGGIITAGNIRTGTSTTTTNPDGSRTTTTGGSNGIVETVNADGSRTTTMGGPNGIVETVYPDGRRTVVMGGGNGSGITQTFGDNGARTTTMNGGRNTGIMAGHVGNVEVTHYVNRVSMGPDFNPSTLYDDSDLE